MLSTLLLFRCRFGFRRTKGGFLLPAARKVLALMAVTTALPSQWCCCVFFGQNNFLKYIIWLKRHSARANEIKKYDTQRWKYNFPMEFISDGQTEVSHHRIFVRFCACVRACVKLTPAKHFKTITFQHFIAFVLMLKCMRVSHTHSMPTPMIITPFDVVLNCYFVFFVLPLCALCVAFFYFIFFPFSVYVFYVTISLSIH